MLLAYLFILLFIIYLISTSQHKEYLEIIKTDDKIFFLLSGDEYYIAPIENKESKIIIKNTVKRYKKELSSIVERIIIINNEYKYLEAELNSIIKP